MLFIDYSSPFNTIPPDSLVQKLGDLGLDEATCGWVLDFLTDRPQVVRIGSNTSGTLYLSTGVPQGCCSSPRFYALYVHDLVSKHSTVKFYKYSDDTTVSVLVSPGDPNDTAEADYLEEVSDISAYCRASNLKLNTSKTKEMIVDFRRRAHSEPPPLFIDGEEVERVTCFKFLGIQIANDLTWSHHTDAIRKKAQQRLHFLRCLKKWGMSTKTQKNFYSCVVESVLTGGITIWYGNTIDYDRKALQRVVNSAERTIGEELPTIEDIYHQRCLKKAKAITSDNTHPGHHLFRPSTLRPRGKRRGGGGEDGSGKRGRWLEVAGGWRWEEAGGEGRWLSLSGHTNRYTNSFYPQAVRKLNEWKPPTPPQNTAGH